MKNRINKYYATARELSQAEPDKPAAFGRAYRYLGADGEIYTDVLYVAMNGQEWQWQYSHEAMRGIVLAVGHLAAAADVQFSWCDAAAVTMLMRDSKNLTPAAGMKTEGT